VRLEGLEPPTFWSVVLEQCWVGLLLLDFIPIYRELSWKLDLFSETQWLTKWLTSLHCFLVVLPSILYWVRLVH
jgi:hypothetical protein